MQEFIDVKMSARIRTPDGYVVVPGHVARTGVQYYRAYELELDGDPMRMVGIFRPPEEVFAADSLASYNGKPITNEHRGTVKPENWRKLASGFTGNARRDGGRVAADLTFTTTDGIEALESGKSQLSAGYTSDLKWEAGVSDGQPYEGVQTNIRINHVALVSAARCGPACRVNDSQPDGDLKMGTRKVVLDGIPLELDDVAAAAVEKVQGQLAAAHTTIDANKAALAATVKYGDAQLTVANPGAIQAVLDEQSRRIADMAKDVMTPEQRDAMVADWVKTMADAKRMSPKLQTDGKTCAAIRREVVDGLYANRKPLIDAVLAGKAVKDADDGAIRTAFAVLASSASESAPRKADAVADAMSSALTAEQRAAAAGVESPAITEDGLPDPEKARQNWLKAQASGFKTGAAARA